MITLRRIASQLLLDRWRSRLILVSIFQTVYPRKRWELTKYSFLISWRVPKSPSGRSIPWSWSSPSTAAMLLCVSRRLLFVESKRAGEVGTVHPQHELGHEVSRSAGQFPVEVPALYSPVGVVPGSGDNVSSSFILSPSSRFDYSIITGMYLGWWERSASMMMTNCPLHSLTPSL